MGGWLPSWLWTPAFTPQGPPSRPFAGTRSDQQLAASESQASATGTAAWQLIAAHGWDLLYSASLEALVTLGQALAAVGGRLDTLLVAAAAQEHQRRDATVANAISGQLGSLASICCDFEL